MTRCNVQLPVQSLVSEWSIVDRKLLFATLRQRPITRRRSPLSGVSLTAAIVSLIIAASPALAQVISIDDIPTPRPRGWSVDLTGQIAAQTLEAIDRLGDEVAQQLSAEVAVVVVGSIGGEDPRRFATHLFNTWGIGNPDLDNGILIFVALEDRAAELILGAGIDEPHQIAIADQIMQRDMMPRFRRDDPSSAVLVGATASIDRILRPLRSDAGVAPRVEPPAEAEQPLSDALAEPSGSQSPSGGGSPLPIVGGVAALLAVLGLGRRRLTRYRPRSCALCGNQCERLGEVEDDAHLERAERTEERIGSVDYDVWACPRCGGAEKLRYGALFTRYSKCFSCGAKTKSKASQILRAATYTSGGLVEVTETCAHCSFENTYTRTTPQLTESSSGSSSSGSSGFGGGSSSGSGSSGRW